MPVPDYLKVVLACIPVNHAELAPDIEYSPGIDYTIIPCDRCGTDMWIGPTQAARYAAKPGLHLRLCAVCALRERPGAVAIRLSNQQNAPRIAGRRARR